VFFRALPAILRGDPAEAHAPRDSRLQITLWRRAMTKFLAESVGYLPRSLSASGHVFSKMHEKRMNTDDFYSLDSASFNCSA
jgi:hypothetical protein